MIRFAYLGMIYYLEEEFGCNWQDLPRMDSSGKWTKIGWAISGFTNGLTYLSEAFEYKHGSKLLYFCFYYATASDLVSFYPSPVWSR
eukprot:scaffold239125_cov63-Cyclotella_meneghiniana.AAC.1